MKTIIKTIVLAAAVSLSLGVQAQGFFNKAPAQEPAAAEVPSPPPVATPTPMPKPTPAAKPATAAADAPKPAPKPVRAQATMKTAEKNGVNTPPVGKAMKPPADNEVITITRTRTLREVPKASPAAGEQKFVEGGADPVAACEADGVSGFLAKGCAGLRCMKDKYKGHSFCLKLAADAEARRAAEQSNYR